MRWISSIFFDSQRLAGAAHGEQKLHFATLNDFASKRTHDQIEPLKFEEPRSLSQTSRLYIHSQAGRSAWHGTPAGSVTTPVRAARLVCETNGNVKSRDQQYCAMHRILWADRRRVLIRLVVTSQKGCQRSVILSTFE